MTPMWDCIGSDHNLSCNQTMSNTAVRKKQKPAKRPRNEEPSFEQKDIDSFEKRYTNRLPTECIVAQTKRLSNNKRLDNCRGGDTPHFSIIYNVVNLPSGETITGPPKGRQALSAKHQLYAQQKGFRTLYTKICDQCTERKTYHRNKQRKEVPRKNEWQSCKVCQWAYDRYHTGNMNAVILGRGGKQHLHTKCGTWNDFQCTCERCLFRIVQSTAIRHNQTMAITEAPQRCRFDCQYNRWEGDDDPLACAECVWQRAWERANADGTVPDTPVRTFHPHVVWCPKSERDCERCFALALRRMRQQKDRDLEIEIPAHCDFTCSKHPPTAFFEDPTSCQSCLWERIRPTENSPAPPMPHSPWCTNENWVCADCTESSSATVCRTFHCRTNLPSLASTSQCHRCFWNIVAKRADAEGRPRPPESQLGRHSVWCTKSGCRRCAYQTATNLGLPVDDSEPLNCDTECTNRSPMSRKEYDPFACPLCVWKVLHKKRKTEGIKKAIIMSPPRNHANWCRLANNCDRCTFEAKAAKARFDGIDFDESAQPVACDIQCRKRGRPQNWWAPDVCPRCTWIAVQQKRVRDGLPKGPQPPMVHAPFCTVDEDAPVDEQDYETLSVQRKADCHVPWCHIAFRLPWGRRQFSDTERTYGEYVGWATHVISSDRPARYKPFIGTSVPPPRPSMLRRLLVDGAAQTTNSWHLYDQSALVASGMVLEDMITALLLPYAQAHVRRCRSLKDDDGEMADVAPDEWLLPFDEAIARLDDDSLILCTTRPPTRCLVQGNHVGAQTAWETWCASQSLQPDKLEQGRNVFSNRFTLSTGAEGETELMNTSDSN